MWSRQGTLSDTSPSHRVGGAVLFLTPIPPTECGAAAAGAAAAAGVGAADSCPAGSDPVRAERGSDDVRAERSLAARARQGAGRSRPGRGTLERALTGNTLVFQVIRALKYEKRDYSSGDYVFQVNRALKYGKGDYSSGD